MHSELQHILLFSWIGQKMADTIAAKQSPHFFSLYSTAVEDGLLSYVLCTDFYSSGHKTPYKQGDCEYLENKLFC